MRLGIHLSGHFSLRSLPESVGSGSATTKPKRRAYLLKRKALTTGFFDNKGKDEKEKGEHKARYRLIVRPSSCAGALSLVARWGIIERLEYINFRGDVIYTAAYIYLPQLEPSLFLSPFGRTNETPPFDIELRFRPRDEGQKDRGRSTSRLTRLTRGVNVR